MGQSDRNLISDNTEDPDYRLDLNIIGDTTILIVTGGNLDRLVRPIRELETQTTGLKLLTEVVNERDRVTSPIK